MNDLVLTINSEELFSNLKESIDKQVKITELKTKEYLATEIEKYMSDIQHTICIPCATSELNNFQTRCRSTAVYPDKVSIIYPILGLIGETGEVAEKTRDYLFPKGCPKDYDDLAMFLKQVYHTLDDAATFGISAGKLSKILRDKNNELNPYFLDAIKHKVDQFTDEQKKNLVKEHADCVWFIMTGIQDLGSKFSEAAQNLLDKLQKRKVEGKLGGEGDNR